MSFIINSSGLGTVSEIQRLPTPKGKRELPSWRSADNNPSPSPRHPLPDRCVLSWSRYMKVNVLYPQTPSALSVRLESVLAVWMPCRTCSTLRGASVVLVVENNHLLRPLFCRNVYRGRRKRTPWVRRGRSVLPLSGPEG